MRPGIITRLALAVAVAAAMAVTAMRAGAADPASKPATMASTAASTLPTTTPTSRPRYVAQIPPLPGFHIIAAGGREAICQASDDDWVKAALLNAGPATKPSTMPSDALHYLEIRHDELARELTADLGLSDQKDVNDFLDNTLRPAIEKIGAIKPRVLYMVASSTQIVDMIKLGWNEPHYHYNRLTGQVGVDQQMQLDANGQMDDFILPCVDDDPKATTKPADAAAIAKKQAAMEKAVQATETNFQRVIASNTPGVIYEVFRAFIYDKGIAPLKLSLTEQWFSFGVTEVLSCRYVGELWGVPIQDLITARTQQRPDNPISLASIDALHPMALQYIRSDQVYWYLDALTRKSAAAVNRLVTTDNEDAIGKVIVKLRAIAPTRVVIEPSTQASTQPATRSAIEPSGLTSTRPSTMGSMLASTQASTRASTQATTQESSGPDYGTALIEMIKSMTNIDLHDSLSR